MLETSAEIRDLKTFRQTYDLPTQQDYIRLLSSADHEKVGQELSQREHAGLARLRADGFDGSTLAEAYTWWLGVGDPDAVSADGCDSSSGCACGGGGCHH